MELLSILGAGLDSGVRFALLGVGFGLITSVFGYFTMSYAILVVVGSFAAYVFRRVMGWPMFEVAGATLLLTVVAFLLHVQTMDRLRRIVPFRDPALFMFLATGALFICLRNGLLLIFGPGSFYANLPIPSSLPLMTTLIGVGLIEAFMKWTRAGLELRAIANSASLAKVVGINIPRIEMIAAGLAGVCAGFAALIVSANQDIRFSMGDQLLLGGALAAFVGGGARPKFVALVGFGMGMLDAVMVWFIPSGWQDFFLSIALLLVIIAAPQSVGRLLQQPLRQI